MNENVAFIMRKDVLGESTIDNKPAKEFLREFVLNNKPVTHSSKRQRAISRGTKKKKKNTIHKHLFKGLV